MNKNPKKPKPYKGICLACQQMKDCLSHLTAKTQHVLLCFVFPQRGDSSQLVTGMLSPHILPLNITQTKFSHYRSCLLSSQNIQRKMQVEDKCAASWQKQMKKQKLTDEKQMNFNGLFTCISCIYSCRYHLQVFALLLLNLFLLGKKKEDIHA